MMQDKIRTFIAFQIPDDVKTSINGIQQDLKKSGINLKWVKTDNIHLTLKFLGDIRHEDVDRIEDCIKESVTKYNPMHLIVKGIGVFPGIKRPRVMWVGLRTKPGPGNESGIEKLINFQKTIEINLDKIGFEKDKKQYKAHLTIGRAKGNIDPKKLFDSMKVHESFESPGFMADRIILYKSDLRPTGPVYTKLKEIQINGNQHSGGINE